VKIRSILLAAAFACALAALIGVLALPSSARAGNGTTITVYQLGGDTNPCTGDLELLNGRIVGLYHLFTDPSGGQHINGNAVMQDVTETDLTTGITLREMQASPFTFETTAGADEITIIGHFKLVGPGGEAFVFRYVAHLTLTPDGQLVVDFQQLTQECS
jgi:hypothetical protein